MTNNLAIDLSRFTTKMARGSQRGLILEEMLVIINEEVKKTPFYINKQGKKVKNKEWSIVRLNNELRHLKEISDLTYMHSICKSYKTRGGTYLKCLRGAIKIK